MTWTAQKWKTFYDWTTFNILTLGYWWPKIRRTRTLCGRQPRAILSVCGRCRSCEVEAGQFPILGTKIKNWKKCIKPIWKLGCRHRGSFNNYVDKILLNFDPQPPGSSRKFWTFTWCLYHLSRDQTWPFYWSLCPSSLPRSYWMPYCHLDCGASSKLH